MLTKLDNYLFKQNANLFYKIIMYEYFYKNIKEIKKIHVRNVSLYMKDSVIYLKSIVDHGAWRNKFPIVILFRR